MGWGIPVAERGGPGNSDSVLRVRLTSPTPADGGAPEEPARQTTRRNHGAAFKAQVALGAFKGDTTLTEWAEHVGVPPTSITDWTPYWLARTSAVCGGTTPKPDAPALKSLHITIGPLTLAHAC
jgi:transposase